MAFQLYYSDVCPDTPAFVEKLKELQVDYQAFNINESIPNLKSFLNHRDHEAAFQARKNLGQVGVPALQVSETDFLFTIDELNSYFGGDTHVSTSRD